MKKLLVALTLTLTLAFGLIGCSTESKNGGTTSSDTNSSSRSVDENNARLKEDIKDGASDVKNNFTNDMNGMMN